MSIFALAGKELKKVGTCILLCYEYSSFPFLLALMRKDTVVITTAFKTTTLYCVPIPRLPILVLDQNWFLTKHYLTISPLTNSSMIILLYIYTCLSMTSIIH
uniref:Uncharacterized protein n=1 Tax=Cacopsylla melanoneura TaxID=428564 RepID=A0A8D8WN02_9HEMI